MEHITKNLIFLIIVFACLGFTFGAQAADRYWVGADAGVTANANTTASWSATSGGPSGASVPGSSDNVIFDGGGGKVGGIIVDADVNVASITATSGYTGANINDGHINNVANNKNIVISGNVIFDNKQISMGDGTWTVGGNWDVVDVTTFNKNASTLVMTGTGKTIAGNSNYAKRLNILTISGSITTAGLMNADTLNVSGTFTLNNSFGSGQPTSNIYVNGSGVINGSATLTTGRVNQLDASAEISVATLTFQRPITIVAGTYESPTVLIYYISNATLSLSGNYVFTGNVEFKSTGGIFTVNNSANNPNLEFWGNVLINQAGGTVAWTKGTGTITLGDNPSNGTQTINFLDKSVEDIVINASGNTKVLTANLTTDTLTETAGVLDRNGYTITVLSQPADVTSPSVPASLTATAVSSSQINLSWVASTDNIAVTGYKIYRSGSLLGTTTAVNYQDTALVQSTSYSYTVLAYDAAGNESTQSAPDSATTQENTNDFTIPIGYAGSIPALLLSASDKSLITSKPLQNLMDLNNGRYNLLSQDGVSEYWGLNELWARRDILSKPYSQLKDYSNGIYQTERTIFADLTTGAAITKMTNTPYSDAGDELTYFGKSNWNANGSIITFQRSSKTGLWGPAVQITTDEYGPMIMNSDGTGMKIAFKEVSSIYNQIASPTDPTKAYSWGGSSATDLLELNLVTGTVSRTIKTGISRWWLKISPDGKYGLTRRYASPTSKFMWVVDLQTGQTWEWPLAGKIHDSYRFVPGNTDWIMYWYESEFYNVGFRMHNFKTGEEKIINISFDWNHADVGRYIGVHATGQLYSYLPDADIWQTNGGSTWPTQTWSDAGYYYDYVYNYGAYIAHWPDDNLWAFPTRAVDLPYLSEMDSFFSKGSDVVGRSNRFRVCLTNLRRETDRLGNTSVALDRPNISPDGTKILFNSNVFGKNEIYQVVARKPLSPVSLNAIWSNEKVNITWSQPKYAKEIKGYLVYRSAESGQGFILINNNLVTATNFQDADVIPGHVYFYSIKSVEYSGLESDLSSEIGVSSDISLLDNVPFRLFAEAESGIASDLNAISPDAIWMNFEGMASNLYYIWQRRNDKSGSINLSVSVPRLDNYYIYARLKGDNGASFTIAGQAVESSANYNWQWVRSNNYVSLSAGIQPITIASSLYGSRLDAIYLSTDSQFLPQGRISATPPAATVLSKTLAGNYVRLNWNTTSGPRFNYYNIYASKTPNFIADRKTLIASVDKNFYLDWQAQQGVNYYVVTSVTLDGLESPVSNIISATPGSSDTIPPVISAGLPSETLTAETASTTLSVTTNENATCKYSTTSNTAYTSMANTFTATGTTSHSATITGLTNGSTYNYYVRCQDTAGNPNTTDYGILFQTASPIDESTPPSAVSNLATSNISQTSSVLTWTSPGNDANIGTATRYDIRYSASNITESNWANATQFAGEPLPQLAGTSQSYTVVGLTPNTTYYFALKTSDEVPNISALSNVVSATTIAYILSNSGDVEGVPLAIDTTPPTVPSNFTGISSENYISLVWNNPSEADFTRVLIVKKENSAPTSKTDGTVVYEGNLEEFKDTNIISDKTYYYSIYAYDTKPNYSSPATISVKSGAIVQVPDGTTETPGTLYLQLNGSLYFGKISSEVTILQKMLSKDVEIYPNQKVTGVFGRLTEAAVQKFQCKYLSLCSGSYKTNGYGAVGPRTVKKLNEIYGTYQSPVSPDLTITKDQLIAQIKAKIAELMQQLIILLQEEIKKKTN